MKIFLKTFLKAWIPAFAGMTRSVLVFFKKTVAWMILRKNWLSFAPALFGVFLSSTASAQISTGIPPLSNAAGAMALLCNIMNVMFWVLISVSIIMILWGAYLYVFAGEDAKRPSEARMTILYALIGIVVALAAKGFPTLIGSIFPGASAIHACEVVNSGVTY
jgi:hypothetical protein